MSEATLIPLDNVDSALIEALLDRAFEPERRQRDRLGRLLMALALNPFAVGLGLDEDTAAFIAPDNVVEIHGSGAITCIDPSGVEFSAADHTDRGQPVTLLGVRLHVLTHGAAFHLHTREAMAPGVRVTS